MSFSEKFTKVLNKVKSSRNAVAILGSQISSANPDPIGYTVECLKGYIVNELAAQGLFFLNNSQHDIIDSAIEIQLKKAQIELASH